MVLIGMPEVANRLGYSSSKSAKRALKNAGVPLVAVNARALAVDEEDLKVFLVSRETHTVGRPTVNASRGKTTEKPDAN